MRYKNKFSGSSARFIWRNSTIVVQFQTGIIFYEHKTFFKHQISLQFLSIEKLTFKATKALCENSVNLKLKAWEIEGKSNEMQQNFF